MPRRQSFGERMGAIPAPNLQLDQLSNDLQVSVWNLCQEWMFPWRQEQWQLYQNMMVALYRELRRPAHEVPHNSAEAKTTIARHILNPDIGWTDFYKFVEFIPILATMLVAGESQKVAAFERMRAAINDVLEQEGSPYRMTVNELAPITNEQELLEVRRAVAAAAPFQLAADHISASLAHLAHRPSPNYHDCAKQAFSAVESTLWIAIQDKPKIPQAVRKFEEKFGKIHGALSQLIEKLHGYASDEEGVRHGATEAATVGEAEARLMLVSCSAMMNFLIRKALKV
jgi:AbiJ N-terminal domain 4